MAKISLPKGFSRIVSVCASFFAFGGTAVAAYDFDAAWKEVDEACGKGLPRTVTNKVEEIQREAIKVKRWPDAARAFLVREEAMTEFTDEQTADWLPAFAASVDAQPAPLQAVLQLHLAHTYFENSRRWRWGGAAPTKLDDEAAADKMPPWSPEKIAGTLEAQFAKVFALADDLKAQKLLDWIALFDHGNVPTSYCPTLFDFAVRDAIRFYGENIPDKTREKGLALYDQLIQFHQKDGNLDALAMAELNRAEFVRAFDQKPQKQRDADFAAFLDDFLARYEGKTEAVAFGAAAKAEILRDKNDLVAAHDLAIEYAQKWPKSLGAEKCQTIIARIEEQTLSVEVERNWCAPWPEMTVKARNLNKVHFRLVPVSFDDLVEDTSMGNADDYDAKRAMRDKYATRRPAKEWSETLDLKPDYTEQVFSCSVPQGLPCGHYVLYAAANDKFGADKLPLFAQYVTVTPLALVLRTGAGDFGGTVYDAESGEPIADARVDLWGYPPNGGRVMKLHETCTTDQDGNFSADFKIDERDWNSRMRHVRVVKDGAEVISLGSAQKGQADEEKPNYEYIDLFTDRALYRPGQEIHVKGVAYHANPHTRDFRTKTEVTVRLTLRDPNGKEVASTRLKPNKWGSFVHTFAAPMDRLTGRYMINAWYLLKDGGRGEANKMVNVEEYKRPKFEASLEKADEKATLGKPVTVTGKALTYSGLPVQGAKVAWHVERSVRYPDWWRWFGWGDDGDDGEGFVAQGEAETDGNGAFTVTFTPVAAPTADLDGDPSFRFAVTATVTDDTGEARTAESSFEIGTVAWRAGVWTDGEWQTAGKPVAAKVSLATLASTAVPVKGMLKVFRLKAPAKPVRKPAGQGRYGSVYERNEKGPWDWATWEQGEEVLAREIATDKAENWQGELPLGVGAYRLVFEAKDPNGKTVKGMGNVLVFDPEAEALGVAVPELFLVEKHTVKVGETMRVFWGTGYESGYCRVRVSSNGKTILDTAVKGKAPVWTYELPVADEHRGKIEVETTFVRENRLYRNSSAVWVPWDNKHLDIEAEHLTSKINPGNEETWTFKVSGPAEVLAFLYDRSLDAYKWHDVSPGFSNHFTPWTPYRASPFLQNAVDDLTYLDGAFPNDRKWFSIVWPSWRGLPSRYRRFSGVMKMKASGGARMRAEANDMEDGMVFCEAAAAPMADAPLGAMVFGEAEDKLATDGDAFAPAEKEKAPDAPPRKNLKETAFFFPDLVTDADGHVSFTFTVPDALTGWKLLMVAHDNELNGGVFRKDDIVTVKPLMCEPNAPRFVREGDDFLFAVKVTNTEDEPQSGEVSLSLEELAEGRKSKVETVVGSRVSNVEATGDDSRQPTTDSPNDKRLATCDTLRFALAPHESRTFEFRVAIPDGCGYLKYVAKAKGEAFADGEEGVLPVLSRRVLVREAVQLHARGAETRSFALTNLVSSKVSDTIRHQDLTVRAVSRPAWYAVLSLPYLMEFPHECCEQTFSRFYANALGAFIANADPRIRATFDAWKAAGAEALKSPLEANPQLKAIALEATPWVRDAEHETAARARLGDLFGSERLDAEQARCLEKLRTERNRDGRWPWFPGGPSSDYITLYILTGFARLNLLAKADYPDFFADATRALDREVAEDVKRRLRLEKEQKIPFRVNGFDVRWLYLHSFAGVPAAKNEKDAKLFVEHLRKEWPEQTLETQAVAATALKRRGEVPLAQEIMASIKERAVLSDELGMYWKRPYFFSCSVFAAPVSTQALVVEAFREVTDDEESADACNVWLLKQKQTQDWTTTAATADAIYALILGGDPSALLAGDTLAEVTLGGEKVPVEKAEAGTGMWSHRYAAGEIRPEMGEITFKGATEKGVAWGGVHWSYFEDVLKVRAHEPKELRVEKKYYKKVKGPEGTRLTAIEGKLEPGDEIVARLEITSDRTYEFVHLSDERPACAEPVDVLSSYRWRDGVGYYQSTKDTATHYYIDRLNKGVFVLETSFRVQQKGAFTGGLATIQCMYAPEFTAHSTAERVAVGPVVAPR